MVKKGIDTTLGNYYFLAASLPPLSIGEVPEVTFENLKKNLELNLSKTDYLQAQSLMRFTDINNIRVLLQEEAIDPRGNLNEKELDEAILIQDVFPDYVFDFLGQFENASDRIKNFSGLLSLFFSEEITRSEGFLKKYFTFERELRLVLVALRAKQLGRDVVNELQFEDFTDPLVAHILAQKDSEQYDPPMEYAAVKELIASCYLDPWKEYKVLAEYRFKAIEEMLDGEMFSIDRILAYMAQLMIIEYGLELNREKGKMILDTFKAG